MESEIAAVIVSTRLNTSNVKFGHTVVVGEFDQLNGSPHRQPLTFPKPKLFKTDLTFKK